MIPLLSGPCKDLLRFLILAMLVLAGCSKPKPDTRSMAKLELSAEAFINAEDFSGAEKELSQIVAQDPKNFDAWIGRGAVRIFLGNAQGSEDDFKAAAALDAKKEKDARFFVSDRAIWRARELDMKGGKTEALKIYDVILKLNPKSGMAYHERGALKIDLKEYDEAIADFTKAIEFDDGNNSAGDSFELRAKAKKAKGDETGAKEDEKRASATDHESKSPD